MVAQEAVDGRLPGPPNHPPFYWAAAIVVVLLVLSVGPAGLRSSSVSQATASAGAQVASEHTPLSMNPRVSTGSDPGYQIVGSIPVGYGPNGIAYDSATSQVFVTNGDFSVNNNVSVISTLTNTVVASVDVGTAPEGVAVDGGTGDVYVADEGSNAVSVIGESALTGIKVVATIPVGTQPTQLVYDGAMASKITHLGGEIYVANSGSDNLSVISDATDTVVATIPLSGSPYSVAYDSGTGQIFVAIPGSAQIDVISDESNTVVDKIPSTTTPLSPRPVWVTYDSGKSEIFAINETPIGVSVISDTNDSVVANILTWCGVGTLAYDAATDEVFEANPSGPNITVISDATNKIVDSIPYTGERSGLPYALAVDTSSGAIYMTDGYLRVYIIEPVYSATFTESGLPSGSLWYLNVSGQPAIASDSADATVDLPDGDYSYSVATANKEYAPTVGKGDFTVAGESLSESVNFALEVYSASFTETGLPAGTTWWVNLTLGGSFDSSSATIVLQVPNGSYDYSVADANPSFVSPSGSFQIVGANVTETVPFSQTYSVRLTETGLPVGTQWWVNVTGGPSVPSTSTIASFDVSNGTYDYVVGTIDKTYAAMGGSITVKGGAATGAVNFALVTFVVTISESGLPSGTEWWVNVSGGPSTHSTSGSATIDLSNGSYAYKIASANKTYSAPAGDIIVSGRAVSDSVEFARVTYSILFTESGLPLGAEWWVNLSLAGSRLPALSATGTTITASLANGSYAFVTSSSAKGYTAPGEQVRVSGAASGYAVIFRASSTSSGATSGKLLGVPAIDAYALFGIVGAAAVLVIAIGLRRRTNGGAQGPPKEPAP